MTAKYFLDTNVAVYAYDSSAGSKQIVAQQQLRDAAVGRNGIISVQVLGEFFHATVTRKKMLTAQKAHIAIAALCHLEVVAVDESMVEQAIAYHLRYQLRYWDALIVATAKLTGCGTVFSEDLNAGQDCDGVKIVNPFQAFTP